MTSSPAEPLRVLILGGSAEANQLASAIVGDQRFDSILSYAGRTENPKRPPTAWRVGGFGGVSGLIDYLRRQKIARVVDATHPFAAQMSAHAITACAAVGVPLLALERAPWQRATGDHWIEVDDFVSAGEVLGVTPRRVFLGIGRTQLAPFASHTQHFYLVRLVDQPRAPLPLEADVIIARGPFDLAGDRKMLADHRIDIVVARDAGGDSASAKIDAARELGLPVVMVRRPFIPDRPKVETVAEVLRWLGHGETPAERGV